MRDHIRISEKARKIGRLTAGRLERLWDMFATFFHELKQAGLPVTLREYLTLMEAMEKDIADAASRIFIICRALPS
jgi:hypothetical protein